jgi:Predicted membrane protein
MKKYLLIVAIIATLAVATIAFTACDEKPAPTTISAEAAKTIALNNLKTPASAANFIHTKAEVNKGITYYDTEFTVNGVKYEYKINALDGNIAKLEINDQTVDAASAPVAPLNPDNDYVEMDIAKNAALSDAGFNEEEVIFTEEQFDFDDGMYLYEFDFVVGTTEYEYEIVAKTGLIHKKEVNKIAVVLPTPTDTSVVYKTVDEVRSIILADIPSDAVDTVFTKIEFELDNGVHVFEVKVSYNQKEFEYEINATTGAIIEKSIDGDNALLPSAATGEYIGTDSAKAIALAHAGLSANAVTEYEGKLEIERGVYIYDVEFKHGGYEYEYEISATTGDVLKVDREFD